MAQRNRYPGTRIDLTGLPDRPLFHDWIVEPDDRSADGAVLTGTVYGHPKFPDGTVVTTSTVQLSMRPRDGRTATRRVSCGWAGAETPRPAKPWTSCSPNVNARAGAGWQNACQEGGRAAKRLGG